MQSYQLISLFQMVVQSRIGNLHHPETVKRFKAITNNKRLISILENGVTFSIYNFHEIKGTELQNNWSSREDPVRVREIIADWESRGFVQRCERSQIDLCNPLTLASRKIYTSPPTIKYR